MGCVTESFAKRLKEIREAAGLTQAQLASELKVSRGAISYYEKGERTPDIEFLDSLSMYFNLPLDFAMGYTDNIKEEHRAMYELYGLTDEACDELDRDPEIGHLISAVLGHEDFYALKRIYKGVIEDHNSFNISQMGYIGFLMSDSLNKIIIDALSAVRNLKLTPEEREALRIECINSLEELERLQEQWAEEDKRFKEKCAKEDEELTKRFKEEEAIRLSAMEKVYDKFYRTIESAESRRGF